MEGSLPCSTGAFGFIHRDDEGIILAHFGKAVDAILALECEAHALVEALQFACLENLQNVVFESDCLTLVNMIEHGAGCPEWKVQKWAEEAAWLLKSNRSFSLSFVPRRCNLAADWIAKSAVKGMLWRSCFDPPPSPLYLIAFDDFSASSGCRMRGDIG